MLEKPVGKQRGASQDMLALAMRSLQIEIVCGNRKLIG